MLIRNYGIFWERKYFERGKVGRGSNFGQLLGKERYAKKNKYVDFREQIGIYALYDSLFNLVYVGQIGKGGLYNRLVEHQGDHLSPRWIYFSWFGLRYVKKNGELSMKAVSKNVKIATALNHLEAVSVAVSEPKLNLQRGRFGDKCNQYLQVIEKDDKQVEKYMSSEE